MQQNIVWSDTNLLDIDFFCHSKKGCLAKLAKGKELDAVGRQFEPCLTAG